MTDLLRSEDQGGPVAEHGREVNIDARGRLLLTDLVNDLASAPSGVSFIATCLDRVVETWNLLEARAVIDDSVLGLQLFNAGRRPFDLHEMPSTILARGAGIHTEPTMLDQADDIDAIAKLCELALRLDRLHYESLHDPLTGLYNRRGFDEHLGAAISRSVRYGWSFGLVIIDLDGFKAINDQLGHQGGDAVLRQVGEQLRQGLRSGDIAARVGGDEFALLLHIDGPASIDSILGRLHGTSGFGDAGDVAWTAGLAMCPDEAATVDDLYRVADQRLYESKATGNDHTSASTHRAESSRMTTDLDRLELELRCLPGVVAVGLDRDATGDGLLIQAVVLSPVSPADLRSRIRRVVDANVRDNVSLEIVVDALDTAK